MLEKSGMSVAAYDCRPKGPFLKPNAGHRLIAIGAYPQCASPAYQLENSPLMVLQIARHTELLLNFTTASLSERSEIYSRAMQSTIEANPKEKVSVRTWLGHRTEPGGRFWRHLV
jgi:hypothetical protein